MNSKVYKPGSVLKLKGEFWVVRRSTNTSCKGCAFRFKSEYCVKTGRCGASVRLDKIGIVYIKATKTQVTKALLIGKIFYLKE